MLLFISVTRPRRNALPIFQEFFSVYRCVLQTRKLFEISLRFNPINEKKEIRRYGEIQR